MRQGTPLTELAIASAGLQRLENLEERLLAGHRLTTFALILTTQTVPPWAERLDGTRAAVLIGPDQAEQAPVLATLRHDPAATLATLQDDPMASPLGASVLVLDLRAAVTEMALAAVSGVYSEVGALGARGDGKSIAGAVTWLLYAHRHRQEGGQLPVRILVASNTFTEHRMKLIRTLEEPLWKGLWQPSHDQHVWTASLGGVAYVILELVGVEDQTGLDRMRQAAHGLWLEEAAPAGTELLSAGLTVDTLLIGGTSLRLPSYHHPILVTSNPGSEAHWTWTRYGIDRHPGTTLVEITPGERASEEFREKERQRLAGRPDLIRRLIDGKPALIVAGQGVLDGAFNPELHVAKAPLPYFPGQPLILGHDGGLTPCTVIAQWSGPQLQILAALASERAGTEQHLRDLVIPWLLTHAPQAELEHHIDPSMATPAQSDLGTSPEKVIRQRLGGRLRDGEVKIQARLDPLLAILGQLTGGRPALVISPTCRGLIEACAARWHYERDRSGHVQRDTPVKDHPASDYGDCLCYVVGGAKPWRRDASRDRQQRKPYLARTAFNPFTYNRPAPQKRSGWDLTGPPGA